ncbi:MAG: hypothetical protein N2201_03495 [candidate division WOR-3 bacterium]|nr:hypothetical protein [candidate division WOR-3 bacterium]
MNSNLLRKVTAEFNRYRYPECKAQTLFNKGNILKIRFSGTKSNSACCFDENFQDFIYYLKDIANYQVKIIGVVRTKNNNFIVTYQQEK